MRLRFICFFLLLSNQPLYAAYELKPWGVLALFAGDSAKDNELGKIIRAKGIDLVETLQKNTAICGVVIIDASESATRYEWGKGKLRKIELARLDLSNPKALMQLWVTPYRRSCFANHSLVIISGQGSGWYEGIGSNNPGQDVLAIQKLGMILETVKNPIDVIALDLGSMSSMEVATELSPYANNMIAFEQGSKGSGLKLQVVKNLNNTVNADILSSTLFKDNENKDISHEISQEISWIDLGNIPSLKQNLLKLTNSLKQEKNMGLISAEELTFWFKPIEDGSQNSDLQGFLKSFQHNKHSSKTTKLYATEALKSLKMTVKKTSSKSNGGISFYIPKFISTDKKNIEPALGQREVIKAHEKLKFGKEINWSSLLN